LGSLLLAILLLLLLQTAYVLPTCTPSMARRRGLSESA
jgi:hypothetical protein